MIKEWTKEELIAFEDKIGSLYDDCQLPFLFHLSGGNEEQLIEIFKGIKENDYVLSNHRSHYHALLHGIPSEVVEQKILGGRSMFIFDRGRNFFSSSIIGGTPAIAAGIAWALKRKKSTQKVWCFIGDGAEDSGHLAEAVRYVDGWELPCTFIVEDNDRSIEATKEDRWGKMANLEWRSSSVIKYSYKITYPHARKQGIIDLSRMSKKSDEEYFPLLKLENLSGVSESEESKISYKDAMVQGMTELGKRGYIFIGYNVRYGDAMGTLKNVSSAQKIETPVAENLMCGLAIGMSFEGFKSIIYFERHDFMLVAADAIVNHIDKIERLSHGEFKVPLVIRAVVADSSPFYAGPTHSQDLTQMFREAVDFPIFDPTTGSDVLKIIKHIQLTKRPVMVVERKSRY